MTRIDMARTNKLGYAAVLGMEAYSSKAVDKRLYELIKLRASILNGCGFCVDMHATDGAKHGIPQRVLHAVGAWQHARNLFEPKELAALALTDAVTKLGPDTVTDEIWNTAAEYFDEGELGGIIMAIATINVWNRIAIATEMQPPLDDKHPIA
jgi:AhpD family alkylhydroperoxidase